MGLAFSLLTVAAGAILAFAVDVTVSGVNLTAIGWILIVVGLVGLVISVVLWENVFGPRGQQRRVPPDAPTRRF